MKAARSTALAAANPEKQLETFISKFDQKDQQLIRAVRRAVRKWFPTANELAWDNFPIPRRCFSVPAIRLGSFGSSRRACWRVRRFERSWRLRSPGQERPCHPPGVANSSSDRFQRSSGRAANRWP